MRWLCFVVASLASCACQGAPPPPPPATAPPVAAEPSAVVVETPAGSHRFRVELAVTPQERARGLMYREQLDDDAGMLFLFEKMSMRSFWMKNTKLPLDMVFIDDKGVIVGIVENAEPLTLDSRSVGRPSRYVLELNGGTCRRLGIEAGHAVSFVGVPGHPAGSSSSGPLR